jgi:hypothetical protein
MENREKMHRLSDPDLAIAAMLNGDAQRDYIFKSVSGRPYPFYRSAKSLYVTILSVASLPLIPTDETLKRTIARKCPKGRKGEIPGNQAIVLALSKYAQAHNVTGINLKFDPVPLGRAGKRAFWAPFILQIDGKRYIPHFVPRAGGLDPEARRFMFSVTDTQIRKQDPSQYGNLGLVIFEFDTLENNDRRVVAHFETGIKLLSDEEISKRVDAVYQVIDAIEADHKASEKKAS